MISGRRSQAGADPRLDGQALQGLRGLGGVNVIASLATTRKLDPTAGPDGQVAYLLVRLADPGQAQAVAAQLDETGRGRGFEALTARAFTALGSALVHAAHS